MTFYSGPGAVSPRGVADLQSDASPDDHSPHGAGGLQSNADDAMQESAPPAANQLPPPPHGLNLGLQPQQQHALMQNPAALLGHHAAPPLHAGSSQPFAGGGFRLGSVLQDPSAQSVDEPDATGAGGWFRSDMSTLASVICS